MIFQISLSVFIPAPLSQLLIPGCRGVSAPALLSLVVTHADMALKGGRAPPLCELSIYETSSTRNVTLVEYLETLHILEASSSLPPPPASEKLRISIWQKYRASTAESAANGFAIDSRRKRYLHQKKHFAYVRDWVRDRGGCIDVEPCPGCGEVDLILDCAAAGTAGEVHSRVSDCFSCAFQLSITVDGLGGGTSCMRFLHTFGASHVRRRTHHLGVCVFLFHVWTYIRFV